MESCVPRWTCLLLATLPLFLAPLGMCLDVVGAKEAHCTQNGQVYADRDVWKPEFCLICVCDAGNILCDDVVCEEVLDCEQQDLVQGLCCPVCRNASDGDGVGNELGCSQNGQVYAAHDIWKPEPCQICMCSNGAVVCEAVQCGEVGNCMKPYLPPGECCTICQDKGKEFSCSQNGQVYADQDAWKPRPCQICVCDHGTILCEEFKCEEILNCNQPYLPPGECCPVCQDGDDGGIVARKRRQTRASNAYRVRLRPAHSGRYKRRQRPEGGIHV
ncbi:cysteine-rich motor neuron 1 protein-like [Polypterus senegalus]|uniref:cysteine-rich motor neuron 1 protein-like n=1 Tax=Polypterus senegalus TaxID=55291 RepID=UPI001965280B|nr:cysteine-rich motor neuron 1 protein-like [Polypterus senegalus]